MLIVPKELAPDKKGQCFILTGTGSEGDITDARAGAVCRDSIIPHLRGKDYAGAVGAGIGAIEARMRMDPTLTSSPTALSHEDRGTRSPLAVVLLGILLAAVGIAGGARY